MAHTFSFNTGRHYDCAQVLEITVPDIEYDNDGAALVTVTFQDKARHIDGSVSMWVYSDLPDTDTNIGNYVLSRYDACDYQTL